MCANPLHRCTTVTPVTAIGSVQDGNADETSRGKSYAYLRGNGVVMLLHSYTAPGTDEVDLSVK